MLGSWWAYKWGCMLQQEHINGAGRAPFGDYELVVQTLVAHGGEKLEVQGLSRVISVFVVKRTLSSVQIAVLRHLPESVTAMQGQLKALMKAAKTMPLDIVLVGGDEEAKRLLQKSRPLYTPRRIGLLHIGNGGRTWSQGPTVAGALLLPFEAKSSGVQSDPSAWALLLQRTAQGREQAHALHVELQAFAAVVKKRKPIATWSIAALIAVIFACELLLGGPGSPPVLVRMGALVPSRIADGEWWRLLSCTFLHAGWVHVLLNVYVLVILGEFLERIIGPARFVVLYTFSAIAGSLGSALLLKAEMSVGASGAVWGLLGAHGILAFRSNGLLPSALIPGAKKAAKINLVINILNSFRPYVDMWAHFAGGAAGAVLFLSGLLTRTLPKLGEMEQEQEQGQEQGSASDRTTAQGEVAHSRWLLGCRRDSRTRSGRRANGGAPVQCAFATQTICLLGKHKPRGAGSGH